MTLNDLQVIAQSIVAQARVLSDKHTSERNAPVNYACIFTQSNFEYEEMLSLARQLGNVAEETAMGPVFSITPIPTEAGGLHLPKIRRTPPHQPAPRDDDCTT